MSLYAQFRPYFHTSPAERLDILRTEALRLSAIVLALANDLEQYYANHAEYEQHGEIRHVVNISLTGAERVQRLFTSEAILLDAVSIDDLQAMRHDLIMPIASMTGSGRILQLMVEKEPTQFPQSQQALIDQIAQAATELRDVLDALADPFERG